MARKNRITIEIVDDGSGDVEVRINGDRFDLPDDMSRWTLAEQLGYEAREAINRGRERRKEIQAEGQ